MKRLAFIPALSCACSAFASEPDFLVGIRETGDVVRIDLTTGVGTPLGGSGIRCTGAIGARANYFMGNSDDYIFTVGAVEPYRGHRLVIDRWIGSIWQSASITGVPPDQRLTGLAWSYPAYYCIFQPEQPGGSALLAKLEYNGTSWSIVGPTGRSDLKCITGLDGELFALGSENGGGLYSINPATGATTFIGGGSFGGDVQAITAGPTGQLYCCGSNLRVVNRFTGQATLVGPIGFSGFSGLAFIRGSYCHAECDGSHHGVTANDFQCFLNRFAAGDPWANCDESTGTPLLTANDFQCFLNEVARAWAGQCW